MTSARPSRCRRLASPPGRRRSQSQAGDSRANCSAEPSCCQPRRRARTRRRDRRTGGHDHPRRPRNHRHDRGLDLAGDLAPDPPAAAVGLWPATRGDPDRRARCSAVRPILRLDQNITEIVQWRAAANQQEHARPCTSLSPSSGDITPRPVRCRPLPVGGSVSRASW